MNSSNSGQKTADLSEAETQSDSADDRSVIFAGVLFSAKKQARVCQVLLLSI